MTLDAQAPPKFMVDYGPQVETEIRKLRALGLSHREVAGRYDPRWLAIKLLEGEPSITQRISATPGGRQIVDAAAGAVLRLNREYEIDVCLAIADGRYSYVGQVVEAAMAPRDESLLRRDPGERLDNVLTHPVLGVLFFLSVMYVVFSLVVQVSAPFLDWIDAAFAGPITNWASAVLNFLSAPAWLHGMLIRGVITGVGGVLVFIPGLIVLFGFMAFLEDSGYLARAAFVMNRSLSWMGLNGKSFVPLVLGFGCAVPAVYATRTLDRRRDRILTAVLIPLMSCSARLPVYVVFSLAFFKQRANLVIWGLYALGVAVAALAGWVFSRTLLREEGRSRFMLELPPYRWPRMRDVSLMVRHRTGDFLKNAGTVILAASISIWLLLNLPASASDLESTYFGMVSKRLAPVFAPAGFGTWEAAGSLVSGLVAKEVVVSTMAQIYLDGDPESTTTPPAHILDDLWSLVKEFAAAVGDAGSRLVRTLTLGVVRPGPDETTGAAGTALSHALEERFQAASALAFLVYVLLYIPCVATLGALRSEFGGRWAAFAALYQSLIAWVAAVGAYQLGRLIL